MDGQTVYVLEWVAGSLSGDPEIPPDEHGLVGVFLTHERAIEAMNKVFSKLLEIFEQVESTLLEEATLSPIDSSMNVWQSKTVERDHDARDDWEITFYITDCVVGEILQDRGAYP